MSKKQNGKVDIVAVAKAAKVSISTVSRSFNHPDLVKPATRKRIDAAIRRLGYIRNRAAQTMHGIRSGTIGIVVPTINHAIFSELIETFAKSVEAHGFSMLLASHGYDLEREYAAVRKFLEHRVDGVALIGLDHSEETYYLLESSKTPTISIWNFDSLSRLSCVGADNVMAGQIAAQQLVDFGHREIGLMFPPLQGNDRATDRFNGALQALAAAGIDPPDTKIVESPYSIAQAKEIAGLLLAREKDLSALLCGNDVLAVGAIYAAQSMGFNVPEDLSIIGIGDFKGSEEMRPALTTVRLPANEIGHLSGQQLASAIIGDLDQIFRVNCAITLKLRDSCARIP